VRAADDNFSLDEGRRHHARLAPRGIVEAEPGGRRPVLQNANEVSRLGNAPRTVLEELARIPISHVALPTTTHGRIRLRCVIQPDAAKAVLLDRLAVVLPKRMGLGETGLPAMPLDRLTSPASAENVVPTFFG
jgi:hypothetical protein